MDVDREVNQLILPQSQTDFLFDARQLLRYTTVLECQPGLLSFLCRSAGTSSIRGVSAHPRFCLSRIHCWRDSPWWTSQTWWPAWRSQLFFRRLQRSASLAALRNGLPACSSSTWGLADHTVGQSRDWHHAPGLLERTQSCQERWVILALAFRLLKALVHALNCCQTSPEVWAEFQRLWKACFRDKLSRWTGWEPLVDGGP